MKRVGIAILGLGVVGGGTYEILTRNREFYQKTQNVDITVESVLELRRERALSLGIPEENIAGSIEEVLANPNVDIVVEVMGGVEAARNFVTLALKSGKSVVTSNKELLSKYWHELERLARQRSVGLYYEASCVGGVPIIRTLLDGLQANRIEKMTGIINGTTNYILTRMTEDNADYANALKEAQRLGYAEANPEADVEGFDAAYKLSILSSLAFHTKVPFQKIYREGISGIQAADIRHGKELGYVLKLLAIGTNSQEGVEVRVHPAFIKADHPLAAVNNSFNAVLVHGDSVGDIMLYGRGAGAEPTGSAIVSDILFAATHSDVQYSTFKNTASAEKDVRFITDFKSAYYIRLNAVDEAGTLAKITGIFSKNGISIVELTQKGSCVEGRVPLVIVTHETREQSIKNTVAKIRAAGTLGTVEAVIRVVMG